MKRGLFVAAIFLLMPLTLRHPATPASVFFPRLIMFYGSELDGRRYITDHHDVIAFMRAVRNLAPVPADTAGRPYVDVGLYWNNAVWEAYAADSTLLKTLPMPSLSWSMPRASDQDAVRWIQPARLYLSAVGRAPLFDWFAVGENPAPRTIDVNGLELLRKYGVVARPAPNPALPPGGPI